MLAARVRQSRFVERGHVLSNAWIDQRGGVVVEVDYQAFTPQTIFMKIEDGLAETK